MLWLFVGPPGFACWIYFAPIFYGGSDLKTYLLMGWWGPGALADCRVPWGLPVGFLLLCCSVLFTVESLIFFNSLLYLD